MNLLTRLVRALLRYANLLHDPVGWLLSGSSGWFDQSATQNFLIWTLNAIIVGIVLTRLLIFGEPVTDRRSPTWTAFMAAKQNSIYAVSVGNYKEARRQLSDALQVSDLCKLICYRLV